MKKIILSFSRFLSGLLTTVLVFAFIPLYVMFTVPFGYWLSGGSSYNNFTDSLGCFWVKLWQDAYIVLFLFPFLPFFGVFFLFSVFVWIFYRHDQEAGKIGFKNTILCILAAFFLILIPMKAGSLGYKIQAMIDKEMTELYKNSDGRISVNKGIDKEFLKLYQTLADEGIQVWRKDPIAVVENELKNGNLTSYNKEGNVLKLLSEDDKKRTATVLLKNDYMKMEIGLSKYWESTDGIWIVKSYKKLR